MKPGPPWGCEHPIDATIDPMKQCGEKPTYPYQDNQRLHWYCAEHHRLYYKLTGRKVACPACNRRVPTVAHTGYETYVLHLPSGEAVSPYGPKIHQLLWEDICVTSKTPVDDAGHSSDTASHEGDAEPKLR